MGAQTGIGQIESLIKLGKEFGLEGKVLLEFVKDQQDKEREERQKELEVEAEEKEKKAQKQHELQLRKMELQSASERLGAIKVSQPSVGMVSRMPEPPKFLDGKDDLDSYLQRFERFARSNKWERDSWAILLSALLTGRALDVHSRL